MKNVNILGDLWQKLMSTLSTTRARVAVWKLQTWSQQRLDVRQGEAPKLVPTRTHCVYRFIVPVRSGEGTSNIRRWSPKAFGLTGQLSSFTGSRTLFGSSSNGHRVSTRKQENDEENLHLSATS